MDYKLLEDIDEGLTYALELLEEGDDPEGAAEQLTDLRYRLRRILHGGDYEEEGIEESHRAFNDTVAMLERERDLLAQQEEEEVVDE